MTDNKSIDKDPIRDSSIDSIDNLKLVAMNFNFTRILFGTGGLSLDPPYVHDPKPVCAQCILDLVDTDLFKDET